MRKIKITVTGCGDAFGSGGRLNTCFYVESLDTNFLIDCGASVLPGLKKCNIRPADIDIIFISHFHGDHYGGLPFFLLESATFHREKDLYIVSPPGCKEKVTQLLSLLYPGSEVLAKLNVQFISYTTGGIFEVENISIQSVPVFHTDAALPHGFRITVEGKTISYSGDTGWTDNLIELSEGADLFICECNFFESHIKGHLNYQTLQEKIGTLNCAEILLTHFDNEMLKNLDHVQLKCAHDGMVLEL